MKKIEAFENAIENHVRDLSAVGINGTVYWAYRESHEAGNDLLTFSEVIWSHDIAPIVKACREYGVQEFAISCTFSSLLETLAEFEKHGCKLAGMTTVKTRFTDIRTHEKMTVPAVLVTL